MLQTKLDPKTPRTVDGERDRRPRDRRGEGRGRDAARRNPAVVAGVALLAGLFFARRPIAAAVRRDRNTINKPGATRHMRKNHDRSDP